MEARRAAHAKLPNGYLAPCRICSKVPDCLGFVVDENSLLGNLRPKILDEVVKKVKSQMELEGVFENRPMGACYAVTRHLQSIMAGSNVDPIWDKCMQKQNYKEEIVTDQDGCKTSMLGYCFPVQAAMDHLACFQKLKPTPSRVGYKSLILFSR